MLSKMTTAKNITKRQESTDNISCNKSLDTDNPVKESAPYLRIKSSKMKQAAVFLCLTKFVVKYSGHFIVYDFRDRSMAVEAQVS